jgi:hypothetical protein
MPTLDAAPARSSAKMIDDGDTMDTKESRHLDIRRKLDAATNGSEKYLNAKTAQKWFQEALKNESPETFFEETIVPRMEQARQMRRDFDFTTQELKKYGDPKSFKSLEPEAFWKLTAKERKVYLANAEEHLENQRPLTKRLDALKRTAFLRFKSITHDDLGASSDKDIRKLKDGLEHVSLNAKEISDWENFLEKAITSAQALYARMAAQLLGAELKGIISKRVVSEREAKFADTSIDYKQKEVYVNVMLPERIAEWAAVKEERDLLVRNPRIHELKQTVPDLADFLSDTKFPDLLYPRRKALVAEVDAALDALIHALSPSDVSADVRRSLSMHDYEGALWELDEAKKNGIDDAELRRLEEYVRQCMSAYEESPENDIDVQAEAETIRGLVGTYPASLQNMYQECLQESPRKAEAGHDISSSLKGLQSIVYNRVWVHEHRHSDVVRDRKNAESKENEERTRDYMEDGHSRRTEHNIIGGETANTAAIRKDNTKAQTLHMKPDGWKPVLDEVKEHGHDWNFRYWVTLNPTEVSYEKQRTIVKNDHWRINSALRKIYKAGYRYTKSGALVPLGFSTPEKKEKKLQAAPVLGA